MYINVNVMQMYDKLRKVVFVSALTLQYVQLNVSTVIWRALAGRFVSTKLI